MTPAIHNIAESMIGLEKLLSACTRCGSCLSVCPVYQITGHEADVARGKLAMLDALADKLFETPAGVMERLDRCLLCGSCAHHCPAGVNVLEIFSKARFILKGVMGLSAVHRAALKQILAEPKRFDRVLSAAARVQNIFLGKTVCQRETVSIPIGPTRIRDRHMVPLAPASFLDSIRKGALPEQSAGRPGMPRVIFFAGCLTDKFFPDVAQTATAALTHAGVHLFIPPQQGCCGMPAVSMGDSTAFARLMQYHVSLLSSQPYDYLVTACATCAAMIKTLWPKLSRIVSKNLATQTTAISEKTMEISQFLVHLNAIPKKAPPVESEPIPITYHDPCHLSGSLGVFKEPRQLIRAIPGYRLVEMEGTNTCCGMGGIFNWRHYDLSMQIGNRKREKILATGAKIVATSCPACMLQLKDLLANTSPGITVKHIMQL
ncbi:MAG: (Fe-S)-binding protein [Desulfobacterales bacterium]|jgi:glycolate oxidase iron-sulfur subunit|nr:(Fe-S)-binding protein [Desulfobacterales bacterium]